MEEPKEEDRPEEIEKMPGDENDPSATSEQEEPTAPSVASAFKGAS